MAHTGAADTTCGSSSVGPAEKTWAEDGPLPLGYFLVGSLGVESADLGFVLLCP